MNQKITFGDMHFPDEDFRLDEIEEMINSAIEICSSQYANIVFISENKWGMYPARPHSLNYNILDENTRVSDFFSGKSVINEHPHLYVAIPLITKSHELFGLLTIEDSNRKNLDPVQLKSLQILANNIIIRFENKSLRKEIQHTKDKFLDLQEMVQAGAWEVDVASGVASWSEGVYDIYQIPRDTLVHKVEAISYYAQHEQARMSHLVDRLINHQEPYDEVLEFIDHNKNRKWIRTTGRAITNQDGKVVKITGSIQNVTSQRRKEDDLKEAQSISRIGSWRFDFATQKQTWSSEHYKIFEIPEPQPQEVLHAMYRERIHPDDLLKLDSILNNTIKTGDGFVFDHRVVLDGGTRIKFVQGIAKVTKDAEGKPIFISGTCRDRTFDIEAENKFKQLIENMSEGLMVKDQGQRIVECNPAAARIIGLAKESILQNSLELKIVTIYEDGSPMQEFDYPSNVALRTGKEVRGVKMGVRKSDQEITWVIANSVPVETSNGRVALTVLSDITDLIKASEENKFILETLGLGLWKFNIKDNSLFWDKSMYELFGVVPEEFSGHYDAWEKTLSLKDKERTVALLQECIKEKKDFTTSFELKDSGRIIGARARLILGSEGGPAFMYGVNFDETEEYNLKQSFEKEKIRSFAMSKLASVGEMAAGVGHEINNPLAIIFGHTLIMRNILEGNDEDIKRLLLERISKIEHAGERISKIITGLKTFSRSDDLDATSFIFSDLLSETVDMIKPLYGKDNLNIIMKVSPNLKMKGNRGRIQQVIINLVNNARDALEISEVRDINITASTDKDKIVFIVQDSGCGISPENQKKVFDAFFTTKPVNKGTGIGLSLVQSIVADHEGEVFLESELGRGSVFKVLLPCEQDA